MIATVRSRRPLSGAERFGHVGIFPWVMSRGRQSCLLSVELAATACRLLQRNAPLTWRFDSHAQPIPPLSSSFRRRQAAHHGTLGYLRLNGPGWLQRAMPFTSDQSALWQPVKIPQRAQVETRPLALVLHTDQPARSRCIAVSKPISILGLQ